MKLIKGILDLAMAVLILLCMLVSVPRLWGYGIYTVTSGSMEPQIHTGDVIYVKKTSFQELEKGDVITFSLNEGKTTVTHRIQEVDQKNRLLQTKGDANEETDRTWISGDAVVGKVHYSIRGLGYLAVMLGSVSGKLFVMAVFLWMLAAQIAVSGIHMFYCRKEMHAYQKEKY